MITLIFNRKGAPEPDTIATRMIESITLAKVQTSGDWPKVLIVPMMGCFLFQGVNADGSVTYNETDKALTVIL